MAGDAIWLAAQRVEAWAGEVRVNLVRLVAIAAFYAHHLINYYLVRVELTPEFHVAMTGVAVAWTLTALAVHVGLARMWNPPALKYAAVAWDAVMITALLLLSDGPKSPLLVIYFLLIASGPLRLNLPVVWVATIASIASYAFVCGHARWVRPEWRVPRTQQVITAIGLLCAGVLAGQIVRQARRFAQDYGERVTPEAEPPAEGALSSEGKAPS